MKYFSCQKVEKIEPKPLLVQHVEGQPAAATYVREKGDVTFDTNRETPCSIEVVSHNLITEDCAAL